VRRVSQSVRFARRHTQETFAAVRRFLAAHEVHADNSAHFGVHVKGNGPSVS
jgi:hypothetical protein